MKTMRNGLLMGACVVAAMAALWPRPAGAEHFDILLRVEASDAGNGNANGSVDGKANKQSSVGEAFMDTTPPLGGVNKRPVVKTHVGQPIRVTWRLKSNFPHGTMKAVTIHFFVVREAEIGQKPVPDPASEAGLMESSSVMDFAPKSSTSGAARFKAPAAGNYLIRVQSEDTHEEHDHEHFSAIDLQVE